MAEKRLWGAVVKTFQRAKYPLFSCINQFQYPAIRRSIGQLMGDSRCFDGFNLLGESLKCENGVKKMMKNVL
jgi:hypothetical protein